MKIIWEHLEIGEWVDTSKSSHKKMKQIHLELRLKNINKCIGKIFISEYACYVSALFSTESDGINKTYTSKQKPEVLKEDWKNLMNELLEKIFKKDLVV